MGFIKRILHPEYPQGGISYDPSFHYDYVVASVARAFGFEANSSGLAQIIWFLEQVFTISVLLLICDFLFKGDKLTLVLVIFTYLMLKSGETDQKTMLRPLHFLAIYYFLKEKWLVAAIFSAALFYLHIGVAIWWFVPSCFAMTVLYLFKSRQVTLSTMAMYIVLVILLASPVLLFYMGILQTDERIVSNDFSSKYFYGINNSILLNLVYRPKDLTMLLITIGMFTVGYMKWRNSVGRNECIVPIVLGVLFLYVFDFVLVDLFFNGIAIKLQLLRSILNVEFFASLFFAFLISRQLRKGNIVFFVAFLMILLVPNSFWVLFSPIDRWSSIYVFYAVVTVYEIFEHQIGILLGNLSVLFENGTTVTLFGKIKGKMQNLFINPVKLLSLIVLLVAMQGALSSTLTKSYLKSLLSIQQKTGVHEVMTKDESLFKDIARFTNEKLEGDEILLVFPFGVDDFKYYTNHRYFINGDTPMYAALFNQSEYALKFQHIFENDLNYSIEKLRDGGSWDEIWRSVNEQLILKWRKEYGITHVIRENELPLDFSVTYKNEYYTIYDLRL